MLDQSHIAELRRRIDLNPTSIAFAELAEEYRKAGKYTEAVQLCRTGLAQHPAYLSARVTRGRALTELDDLPSAQAELEQVLRVATTSLPALRALAEVHQRRKEFDRTRELLEKASAMAHEGLDTPDMEEPSEQVARFLEEPELRSDQESPPEHEVDEPARAPDAVETTPGTDALEPVPEPAALDLAPERVPVDPPPEPVRISEWETLLERSPEPEFRLESDPQREPGLESRPEPAPERPTAIAMTRSLELQALERFLARIESASGGPGDGESLD